MSFNSCSPLQRYGTTNNDTVLVHSRIIVYFYVEIRLAALVNFSFKPALDIWNRDQCHLPKKHSVNKWKIFLFNFQLFRTNVFHVSFISRNVEITFFKTEKQTKILSLNGIKMPWLLVANKILKPLFTISVNSEPKQSLQKATSPGSVRSLSHSPSLEPHCTTQAPGWWGVSAILGKLSSQICRDLRISPFGTVVAVKQPRWENTHVCAMTGKERCCTFLRTENKTEQWSHPIWQVFCVWPKHRGQINSYFSHLLQCIPSYIYSVCKGSKANKPGKFKGRTRCFSSLLAHDSQGKTKIFCYDCYKRDLFYSLIISLYYFYLLWKQSCWTKSEEHGAHCANPVKSNHVALGTLKKQKIEYKPKNNLSLLHSQHLKQQAVKMVSLKNNKRTLTRG